MTHDARLAALERRGYTRRQAEFLTLVLLHSGYFLRRQHAAFFGVEDGARTTDFVRALVQHHLATRRVFDRQTQVFRIGSGMLYDAIGEPDSRLRRAAEPDVVTHRLMTLDVLTAFRERPCLATEAEKVDFFTDMHHVPVADLPGHLYRSHRPDVPPTTRHFVDRVPVLIGGFDVTFVYVQGWAPLGAFASFLNAYTPLLRRLPHAVIRFCTPDERVIERAARMCHRRFGAGTSNVTTPVDAKVILAHFDARRRFETRQFRTFTERDLERLRRDLDRFQGPYYEMWYDRWRVEGDAAQPPLRPVGLDDRAAPGVQFVPHILSDRYPFSGRIQEAA
jgi:hypothetical protein